ncbi:6-phosphogluconolactonase [Radiomyces spectabilis]|uniref:6-phosphogluconolactonase n=1 Tax=Radiomyces spectabilis TaxID=64574 RepID=UPI002220CEC5|nr:6-phosphogluconolactonase [Radiomyces spectabilis]KAI8393267.1 6-phosphogluconolactonase [Radiomyces spectabilis]
MTQPIYPFWTHDALSKALNDLIESHSRDAVQDHGEFRLVVTGGTTPPLIIQQLQHNTAIDFSKWHIFWADERCVPWDHPDSNYGQVKKAMLDHLPLQPHQIHAIHPDLARPEKAEQAAEEYEKQLKQFFKNSAPCFDLVLVSMGPDGHFCSLFPGHPLLEEHNRWVAAITDSPKPPPERITLTYKLLNQAKQIVIIAVGKPKAYMVSKVLSSDYADGWPTQRLEAPTCWYIDADAARFLNQ